MTKLTTLTYKELECLIKKLHVILSSTTGCLENLKVQHNNIVFKNVNWRNDRNYHITSDGNVIRFDNAPSESNILYYDYSDLMCFHFNEKMKTFCINNKKTFEEFDYDVVVNEKNTLAISTMIDIPDDFEKYLDLYGKYGNMFLCIDNISFIEQNYDSIMTLLEIVVRRIQ